MRRFAAIALLVLVCAPGMRSQQVQEKAPSTIPNFDIRESLSPVSANSQGEAQTLVARRKASLAAVSASAAQRSAGTRIVPNDFGLPKLYARDGQVLAAAVSANPAETAKSFLLSQPGVFAMNAVDVDGLRLVREDFSGSAGFLAFNQTLNGIEVYNGQIKFTMTRDGQIVQVATGDLVPGLNLSTTPRLTAEEAVNAAFRANGRPIPPQLLRIPDPNGRTAFSNPGGSQFSAITTELSIFPLNASSARLAYRVFLESDSTNWHELLIDAETGELLFRHNLYVNAAKGNVFRESPSRSVRALVTFPDGWLPPNGPVTTGNNVDAWLDANGDESPDSTNEAGLLSGRASSDVQVFDFPFAPFSYPSGLPYPTPGPSQPASVTNTFYLVNVAHDYYYALGFNEAAGNFQTSNFGLGGTGNDAVIAQAQHGGLFNNASFSVTVDGIAPRMRLGVFVNIGPFLTNLMDSAFDGQVVLHEYGHGVSVRLVGSGTSTTCLNRIQSGAMGEGWSDYFAISYFSNPIFGAYTSRNASIGARRYSYENYPLTYEDLGAGLNGYAVHDDGEIWAATLWDLRKSLGASLTDQLVMNGLKGTPCNPSMTDARDAILSADLAANSGSNRAEIWRVFARHGMGYSAIGIDGTLRTGTRYDAAFDLPPDLQTRRNPLISSNPLLVSASAGAPYAYTVAVSNPEGGTLSFALAAGPTGMGVDPSSGTVTWTGTFIATRVKVVVTDDKGGKVVHGFALPAVTALTGQPLTISAARGKVGYATISVPEGTSVLQIKSREGGGDADLGVISPTGSLALSLQIGSTETLSFANPAAGIWEIAVNAYRDYAGVKLSASLIEPTSLGANTVLADLSGDFTSETFYKIRVQSGLQTFRVSTSGGTGDVDIFVRADAPAVCQRSNAVIAPCLSTKTSANEGNSESVVFTNPAAGDYYVDIVGNQTYANVKLVVSAGSQTLTLAAPGGAAVATSGMSETLQAGYATATVASGLAPHATAVFRVVQNGTVVSEAGIPASPPKNNSRVIIEYRTGVAAGSGTLDISTGLAIVNPNATNASFTLTLRNRNGQTLTTGHGTLAAGAHRARFIQQLQEIAPDFVLPADFSTAILYGSLDIVSTQPLSVLGLRLTRNQRGETLLTSTAVVDLGAPASASLDFPHVTDGGGFATSIFLSNTSTVTQTGTIIFRVGGDVKLSNGSTGTSLPYSIPPAGTLVLQTDGSPAETRAGSASISPTRGQMAAPVGALVLSNSHAGILVSESGVSSATATRYARIYVDRSGNYDTGLALSGSSAVTVQLYRPDGTFVGASDITVLTHTARLIGEVFPDLPPDFTGVANITSSVPIGVLTLRLLKNERGETLMTTFPAADLTSPASSPIIFPQIADGGGYTTQFIFISGTAAGAVEINFFDDNGQRLTIPSGP